MHSFLYALPFLATIAGVAQTQPIVLPVALGQCPVGITVEQQGWGRIEWTVSQEDLRTPQNEIKKPSGKSGVNVALKAPAGKALSRAELVVYYLEPRGRVLSVPESEAPAPEQKKTFDLSAEGGSAGKISGSLLVGAAAGITRVQLMSVRYANGEEWSGSGCSAKPSLYMPVAH